ncbi:hypothetical protein AB1Y20_016568 [Prymnesium parvum]|uniref:Protein kinase domain-containing protein n=1 Tax=Prymnesium parvum TaxID=97485 RepID=A0AB34IBZ4_PRYPA
MPQVLATHSPPQQPCDRSFALESSPGAPLHESCPQPSRRLADASPPPPAGASPRLGVAALRHAMAQLLAALVFLRVQGVLHADVKPDNIMVVPSEGARVVHLIDFSNAMRLEEAAAYHDTFDVVTLAYRAPEVVYGAAFSFPIDMWATAVTIAELFCGRRLIHPASRGGLAMQFAELLGRPPAGLFDESKYSAELLALVAHMPSAYTVAQVRQRLGKLLGATASQEQQLMMDLLAQILRYDASARLTPHEALCHPFFCSVFPFRWLAQGWSLHAGLKREGNAKGSTDAKAERKAAADGAAEAPAGVGHDTAARASHKSLLHKRERDAR